MRSIPEMVDNAVERYAEQDIREIYHPATVVEREAYEVIRGTRMAVRPRVKELAEYGRLAGIGSVGIAFCIGLKDEAERLSDFLEKQDFNVASILCKCGAADKTELGVEQEFKIDNSKAFEAGCNPVLQAEVLNGCGTEMNVIVGLCLGHDMLFTKYSKAPVTTFIVKDRLLGHNPRVALYSAYHSKVIREQRRK
jgi:uncharacterized metal-binding protein